MKITERASLAAFVAALGLATAAHAADATHPVVADQIVVRGAKPALVIDDASVRIDVKQNARSLGRSVGAALGTESGEMRVAAAGGRTRANADQTPGFANDSIELVSMVRASATFMKDA